MKSAIFSEFLNGAESMNLKNWRMGADKVLWKGKLSYK